MKKSNKWLMLTLAGLLVGACNNQQEKPADEQKQEQTKDDGASESDKDDGESESGKQECADSRFTGENCDQCADNRFTGANCDQCADSKFTGANCDQCADSKFTGANCDQCADSHFTGANCDQCADSHFTGANCDQCSDMYTGENCDVCKNGKLGADCDQCADSRFTGENCDQCVNSRFYGENCDQCADNRYTGENCDQCVDGLFGTVTINEKSYKTVCINGQFWMAENMAEPTGTYYHADGSSDDGNTDLDGTYGLFYDLETALTVCPSGWRLPSGEDFMDLLDYVEKNKKAYNAIDAIIAQSSTWGDYAKNATDEFGLGFMPGGTPSEGQNAGLGMGFLFWAANSGELYGETGHFILVGMVMNGYGMVVVQPIPEDELYLIGGGNLSVRCIEGCSPGFTGENCEHCAKGYFGENCQPVTCRNGEPNDGKNGDGHCKPDSCAVGASGLDCDQCLENYHGLNCVEYGTVSDSDGNTYNTIVIGDQTWMADNMKLATGNYYHPEDNSDNDAEYGLLYDWETATKICPAGWHLPTKDDWDEFMDYVSKNMVSEYEFLALISKSEDWEDYPNKGGDDFGFAVRPAGGYYYGKYNNPPEYHFGSLYYQSRLWSSTPAEPFNGKPQAYALNVYDEGTQLIDVVTDERNSVRCIKGCLPGFAGENCDECADGHFGPDCQPVTCKNGTADEGMSGNGHCQPGSCVEGAFGDDCDQCKENYYGHTCKEYGSVTIKKISYKTVEIGRQTWTAENLRSYWAGWANYRHTDGSIVYTNLESYHDYPNHDKSEDNIAKYGYLYNLHMFDYFNLCPSGWHMPTQADFLELSRFVKANAQGDPVLALMAKTEDWAPYQGTDEFGFAALPAGFTDPWHVYQFHETANFWVTDMTETKNGTYVYSFQINPKDDETSFSGWDSLHAYSMRCVKDYN